MITVKVIRVPGAVTEVGLEDNANTVADALNASGQAASSGEAVSLNGATVEASQTLSDGDRIVIAKAAKGNG